VLASHLKKLARDRIETLTPCAEWSSILKVTKLQLFEVMLKHRSEAVSTLPLRATSAVTACLLRCCRCVQRIQP